MIVAKLFVVVTKKLRYTVAHFAACLPSEREKIIESRVGKDAQRQIETVEKSTLLKICEVDNEIADGYPCRRTQMPGLEHAEGKILYGKVGAGGNVDPGFERWRIRIQ